MLRKSTWTLALILFALQTHAAPISGQGTWETTLQARDADPNTPGIEAYYDTDLNITWLTDANYAQTSGIDADGNFTFQEATSWVGNLTYLGVNNWQFPSVTDNSPPGCMNFYGGGPDCQYNVDTNRSQLAHMYYITLGNAALALTNTGPFSNVSRGFWAYDAGGYYIIYDDVWWPYQFFAWSFNFSNGYQFPEDTLAPAVRSAWAVTNGDPFAPVPIPPAAWLLGSALGLMGLARRKSIA